MLLHSLTLSCLPPPQVSEHWDHWDHSVYSGHLSSLHPSSSLRGTLQGLLSSSLLLFLPLACSSLHSLSLTLNPPPQVRLHSLHGLHSVGSNNTVSTIYLPTYLFYLSTIDMDKYLGTFSCCTHPGRVLPPLVRTVPRLPPSSWALDIRMPAPYFWLRWSHS